MQVNDTNRLSRLMIVVALALVCACPGKRRATPTRECGVAQEVCNHEVCACLGDSTCTELARPHCASDTASVCCNSECNFVLAAAPAQCECIVGEVRACGNGGTQACLDQNPGSLSADTDKAIWDPTCHEPPPVETWYRDDDGDGFCGRQQASAGSPGAGWTTSCPTEPAACEGIAAVHVPSTEVPGDGIDNDCADGDAPVVPPPVETWYRDDDGDGFCGRQQASAGSPGAGWSTSCPTEPAACEGIAAVHVPSTEVPGDGIDNDCVGGDAPLPPPPATTYFQDPDADGYCGTTQDFTSDPGAPWKATCARREPAGCENDPTRNPGRREICGNGKDDDCKGGDLACPQPECPPQAPMKCECSGGFVSDCMSATACRVHHPHCGGNPPRDESCSCRKR